MSQTASFPIDHLSECPRCGLEIQRAFVGAMAVEVWHEKCWRDVLEPGIAAPAAIAIEASAAIAVETSAAIEAPVIALARRAKLPRVMIAGTSAFALAIVGWFAVASPSGSAPPLAIAAHEPVVWMAVTTQSEVPNAAVDPLAIHKIPTLRGTPILELYPSLGNWIHPVVNTTRTLPELSSGGFGAERNGAMRRECGQGHCGNDINGPIGRPIVAVADGTVVHVEHSRLGADKRSGRYVRIEHDDGTNTSYMHLHSIVAGLERGDRVVAGQQIGTLGRTAIKFAPAHLHFALAVPTANRAKTRYIDPAPYLLRAKVIDAADRRPPQKPVW